MFTGLVVDKGQITDVTDAGGVRRFRVEADLDLNRITMGASIMHSGVCLTVVEFGASDTRAVWFDVEAIPETLNRTVLGNWETGTEINLEPSLRMGDELGGHYVFGHVDCVGQLVSLLEEGGSYRLRFAVPDDFAKFVAEKGSVAIDGVSLTVAGVGVDSGTHWFEVTIIPHTWDVTTLANIKSGDRVNLEADMLARYVARITQVAGK